jgi:predicted RNA methylase
MNVTKNLKMSKKNDLVIDIGASIGDFSILASKKGAKKIYAIEMNKKLVQIMKKNIKFNNAKNIIIINKKINSLDEIFNKYKIKECNFLKVDCEGCEYKIFKKINQSNLKKIKYIALEIHLFNEKMKKEFSDIKKLLIRNKFKLEEIDNPVHNYLKFLFAQNEIT